MGQTLSARVAAAISAVALLSLAAALEHYSAARATAADPYGILVQEERFREAGAILPSGAVVGYISDVPFEEVRGSVAFFGAQYALAPGILVDLSSGAASPEWVLGDFARPADLDALARSRGLSVVRDFGRGVMVFRKAAGSRRRRPPLA
jgi:hypothetical protein